MEKVKRLAKYAPFGGLVGGLVPFLSLYVRTRHCSWFVFLCGFVGGVVATFVLGLHFMEMKQK